MSDYSQDHADDGFEEIATTARQQLLGALPQQVARLHWGAGSLARYRSMRLSQTLSHLYFTGEHSHAESYLEERGRHTTSATFADLFADAGIGFPQVDFGDGMNGVVHLTATRG